MEEFRSEDGEVIRHVFPDRMGEAMADPRPPKRVRDVNVLKAFRLKMMGEPCWDCELRPGTEVHHDVFRSQGGGDTADNLRWLCRPCHDLRHGINPG